MVGPFGNVDAALVDEYRWGKRLNDNGGRWKIRIASVRDQKINRGVALRVDVDAHQRVQLRAADFSDANVDDWLAGESLPFFFVRVLDEPQLLVERRDGSIEELPVFVQLTHDGAERLARLAERQLLRVECSLLLRARLVRFTVRGSRNEHG